MNDQTMLADNPRAVIGSNEAPDFAKMETERLVDEYRGLKTTLDDLVGDAEKVPKIINDDPTALKTGAIIKRFRDLRERMENTRVVEVEPHLRRQNAINAFFKGLQKMIQPEDKSERRTNPGWIDKLQAIINAYQDRKEAAERERLAREAAEAERIAKEARDHAERARLEEERLQREAAERRAEAERARAPAQIEKKQEVAAQASQDAGAQVGVAIGAKIEAEQATDKAQGAYIATLAKPADIVRTRGVTEDGAGVTLTKAKESYAYVIDSTKLDAVKLFPYFTDAEIEKAVRAFAKATQYREKMDGAEIGWRTKGVTR
jgi:hypothetical protein